MAESETLAHTSPFGAPTGGGPMDDAAHEAILRDIDVIMARIEIGISSQRTAMNALLERLASTAP